MKLVLKILAAVAARQESMIQGGAKDESCQCHDR